MPKRIQRKRAKGWRLPAGAVCVDRTTKWGNPFVVGRDATRAGCVNLYRLLAEGYLACSFKNVTPEAQRAARLAMAAASTELRGKDLACYCSLDGPCHADILLALANGLPLGPAPELDRIGADSIEWGDRA